MSDIYMDCFIPQDNYDGWVEEVEDPVAYDHDGGDRYMMCREWWDAFDLPTNGTVVRLTLSTDESRRSITVVPRYHPYDHNPDAGEWRWHVPDSPLDSDCEYMWRDVERALEGAGLLVHGQALYLTWEVM